MDIDLAIREMGESQREAIKAGDKDLAMAIHKKIAQLIEHTTKILA